MELYGRRLGLTIRDQARPAVQLQVIVRMALDALPLVLDAISGVPARHVNEDAIHDGTADVLLAVLPVDIHCEFGRQSTDVFFKAESTVEELEEPESKDGFLGCPPFLGRCWPGILCRR